MVQDGRVLPKRLQFFLPRQSRKELAPNFKQFGSRTLPTRLDLLASPQRNHLVQKVRIGLIGAGLMGQGHARNLLDGRIARAELTALCDTSAAALARFPNLPAFRSTEALFGAGVVDAVLIATPHYAHTDVGVAALQSGLHVLVEKPISVHRTDAERLIAAHRGPPQVFAAMFNQRTDPCFREIRRLVRSGDLGTVRRVQWTITNWFRPHAYYASGTWRATWAGEGGGVLLNQCPHQLDLYQWIFGPPRRVTGFCHFGRYHDIEVEDDVTAHFEHDGGLHGTFIASTGEAPGTNRLEIAAENGRIVYENERLVWLKNDVPTAAYSRQATDFFATPPHREIVLPASGHGGQHVEVLQNFVDAILDGTPLIAPAAEGLHSVELANAILQSAWTGTSVSLPLDGERYAGLLRERIAQSSLTRKNTARC